VTNNFWLLKLVTNETFSYSVCFDNLENEIIFKTTSQKYILANI